MASCAGGVGTTIELKAHCEAAALSLQKGLNLSDAKVLESRESYKKKQSVYTIVYPNVGCYYSVPAGTISWSSGGFGHTSTRLRTNGFTEPCDELYQKKFRNLVSLCAGERAP